MDSKKRREKRPLASQRLMKFEPLKLVSSVPSDEKTRRRQHDERSEATRRYYDERHLGRRLCNRNYYDENLGGKFQGNLN